jgi:hypothetical protein
MLTQEIQIKLTAFALGETDFFTPEELEEIKSLLMADAEARAFVQEVKETGASLSAELAQEKSPGLTSDQKTTIDKAAVKKNPFKLSRYLLPLSAVAASAIAVFVYMDWEKHTPFASSPVARSYGTANEVPAWMGESKAKDENFKGPVSNADLSKSLGRPEAPGAQAAASKSEAAMGNGSGGAKSQAYNLAWPGPAQPSAPVQEWRNNSSAPATLMADAKQKKRDVAESNALELSETTDLDSVAVGGKRATKESAPAAGSPAPAAVRVPASRMKNSSEVKGVHQSQVVFDQNNNYNLSDKAATDGEAGKSKAIANHSALNIEATTPYTGLMTSPPDWETATQPRFRQEAYDAITENPYLKALGNPLSTFSIDVDTASYSNVRRMIANQQRPPRGAVRIEEFINYFPYEYSQPVDGKPFAVHVETHPAPWAQDHLLMKVGLKGKEIAPEKLPPANLVFLIDVSGSMNEPTKLPLVVQSLKLLVTQLRDQDQVAMVVYAGSSGLVLPSTSGKNKAAIMGALDKLSAGGSTNGGQGIALAYKVATESFIQGGSNRVILMTDGDFNVGVTSRSDLNDLIVKNAKTGVYLSIFGFGMGNLKDSTLEELSRKGNGNYGYIDTLKESQKALVEQMAGTLYTIAKDVKIQVEFNPNTVKSYRLIGYENRIMAKEDFNNDLKDAGDIGAGHTVTALYEIIPAWLPDPAPAAEGAAKLKEEIKQTQRQIAEMKHTLTVAKMTEAALKSYIEQIQALENKLVQLQAQEQKLGDELPKVAAKAATPEVDPLKYQAAPEPVVQPKGDPREMLTIKLRYKAPDAADVQGTSKLIEVPVKFVDTRLRIARPRPSADFNFAAAVAEFGMILRRSEYAGNASLSQVLDLAENGMGNDTGGHRADFIKMVRQAQPLMPQSPKE